MSGTENKAAEGGLTPVQEQLKSCLAGTSDRVVFSVDFDSAEEAKDMDNMVEKLKNLKTDLTIRNPHSQKSLVFKIKTTAPLNYVVKPNSGILEPQMTSTIDITFVPSEVSDRHPHNLLTVPLLTCTGQRLQEEQIPPPGDVLRAAAPPERGHRRRLCNCVEVEHIQPEDEGVNSADCEGRQAWPLEHHQRGRN